MFETKITELLKALPKLPTGLFTETDGGKYKVLWLIDRQKPSVQQSYDFDEERFGVTQDGKIIWGFDSGCSCPTPWGAWDYGDENYNLSTYKEMEIAGFPELDTDWKDVAVEKIISILDAK